MKASILTICPNAQIIDLAHDIGEYNIKEGARILEATNWLPVGNHVCVVDPGVGTERRGIAIETKRGDMLIGPDNGVLIPAARFLGGIVRVHKLENEKYMRLPVSPIFHGRDVFSPAAAHLAAGIPIQDFGNEVPESELVPAAYEDAKYEDGIISAEVLVLNNFGSCFLNIQQEEMHKLAEVGENIALSFDGTKMSVPYHRTFGDVAIGEPLILDDDFSRVELAVNQGNFSEKYGLSVGDAITLQKQQ